MYISPDVLAAVMVVALTAAYGMDLTHRHPSLGQPLLVGLGIVATIATVVMPGS